MAMAEAETTHRHHMDNVLAFEQIESRKELNKLSRVGQVFAFIVATSSFAGSLICVWMDAKYIAGLFLGPTLVGLISAFYSPHKNKSSS